MGSHHWIFWQQGSGQGGNAVRRQCDPRTEQNRYRQAIPLEKRQNRNRPALGVARICNLVREQNPFGVLRVYTVTGVDALPTADTGIKCPRLRRFDVGNAPPIAVPALCALFASGGVVADMERCGIGEQFLPKTKGAAIRTPKVTDQRQIQEN